MCPACIETAAVIAAGAASTGGILAMCVANFRKLLRANGLGLMQKIKERNNMTTKIKPPPIVSAPSVARSGRPSSSVFEVSSIHSFGREK